MQAGFGITHGLNSKGWVLSEIHKQAVSNGGLSFRMVLRWMIFREFLLPAKKPQASKLARIDLEFSHSLNKHFAAPFSTNEPSRPNQYAN